VLEEAADESFGREGGDPKGIGFGVAVSECDLTVLEDEDVLVADGDAEDIGGEVFEGGLAASDGDNVYHPALAPDLPLDLMKQPGLLEQVSELGAEDLGQGFFRQEVVVSGRSPCAAIWGHSAARDQVVDMGVVAKISGPSLQDAHHAEGRADVFGIRGELLEGLPGSLEEDVIDGFLMAPRQGP